jgi:hypothetical protein
MAAILLGQNAEQQIIVQLAVESMMLTQTAVLFETEFCQKRDGRGIELAGLRHDLIEPKDIEDMF